MLSPGSVVVIGDPPGGAALALDARFTQYRLRQPVRLSRQPRGPGHRCLSRSMKKKTRESGPTRALAVSPALNMQALLKLSGRLGAATRC